MLIPRSRYEEAVSIAAKVASTIKVVDPKQGTTNKGGEIIGPLANGNQFVKVQGLIKKGIEEGARVVVGGLGRPEGFNKGYFVKPTIFAVSFCRSGERLVCRTFTERGAFIYRTSTTK